MYFLWKRTRTTKTSHYFENFFCKIYTISFCARVCVLFTFFLRTKHLFVNLAFASVNFILFSRNFATCLSTFHRFFSWEMLIILVIFKIFLKYYTFFCYNAFRPYICIFSGNFYFFGWIWLFYSKLRLFVPNSNFFCFERKYNSWKYVIPLIYKPRP